MSQDSVICLDEEEEDEDEVLALDQPMFQQSRPVSRVQLQESVTPSPLPYWSGVSEDAPLTSDVDEDAASFRSSSPDLLTGDADEAAYTNDNTSSSSAERRDLSTSSSTIPLTNFSSFVRQTPGGVPSGIGLPPQSSQSIQSEGLTYTGTSGSNFSSSSQGINIATRIKDYAEARRSLSPQVQTQNVRKRNNVVLDMTGDDVESDEQTIKRARHQETTANAVGYNSSSSSATTITTSSTARPPSEEAYEEQVKSNLKCNICLEIFYKPITLVPCSHMYCAGCFAGWNKLSCPLCREKVSMVLDAPKNMVNMVDDYVKKCPSEARSEDSKRELDKKDNLRRGVSLATSHSQLQQIYQQGLTSDVYYPQQSVDSRSLNAGIDRFLQVTQTTREEALNHVFGAFQRGLTVDHAINHYYQTARRSR